jgi:hypothetical protein
MGPRRRVCGARRRDWRRCARRRAGPDSDGIRLDEMRDAIETEWPELAAKLLRPKI